MREIFVFGSNLAGRHGRGAAKWAREHRGAIYGQGKGLQGDSYAIPTKNRELTTLALPLIAVHIDEFIRFARIHQDSLCFQVTPIGTGLAGYRASDIGPLFREALGLPNVKLPEEFLKVISPNYNLPVDGHKHV